MNNILDRFQDTAFLMETNENGKLILTVEVNKTWVGELVKQDPDNSDEENEELSEFEIKMVIEQLNNRKLVLGKNQKIFFMEGTAVPRFKIKQFCENNRMQTTRDKSKADIIFYSKDTIDKCFKNNSGNQYQKSYILNKLKGSSISNKIQLITAIQSIPRETVFCDYNISLLNLKDDKGKWIRETMLKNEDIIEIMFNSKYINQDEILRLVSSTVIGEHEFNEINKMLDSNDSHNHVVALELMANSDYEASFVYLSELLKRHYNSPIRHTKTKNHVSFKAMLSYMDMNLSFGYDHVTETMVEKKIFTQKHADRLMKFILAEVQENENYDNYEVTLVNYKKEVQAQIIPNVVIPEPTKSEFLQEMEAVNKEIQEAVEKLELVIPTETSNLL